MVIACLPSETTYDVQCHVGGRGFLCLSDTGEGERAALRRSAAASLAAQHNRMKGRADRRHATERRSGQPDTRLLRVERRQPSTDRRLPTNDRREVSTAQRATDKERRTDAPSFRRGSGAVHPRDIFYLQGWDGPTERNARSFAGTIPLQQGARC